MISMVPKPQSKADLKEGEATSSHKCSVEE